METRAEAEVRPDYAEMAALATQAFGPAGAAFRADRLQWFYERCFSLGATIIALRAGDRKVGQIALVRQTVMADGEPETAAQLVDLFVLPEFRGRDNLRKLYDEVGKQFVKQDIRFAVGMPNGKALKVNEHFFKLKSFLRLPLRMGVAMRDAPGKVNSVAVTDGRRSEVLALLADHATPAEDNGIPWDADSLLERLGDAAHPYALHDAGSVLLVSSPRQSRGIPYTMLCGFFARRGAFPSESAVSDVVHGACAFWHRPIFAYAGVNKRIPPLPGLTLPEKIRPSPLLVQLRDFKPERGAFHFDRFQVLDFDLG